MRIPSLAIFSTIGLIAVLLPSPWHWRARNVATLALITWLSIGNLTVLVNALVWADNIRNSSPGLCDLSLRIYSILTAAIPACSLAQMRRLESIAASRRVNVSAREKSQLFWMDIVLCVAIPLLQILFDMAGMGHRYDIYENIGCLRPSYTSWLSLVLSNVWPLLLALCAFVYGALTLRWFVIKRLQFNAVLAASQSGLTNKRFFRLISLAAVEGTVSMLANIIALSDTLSRAGNSHLSPVLGWTAMHLDYGMYSQLPQDTTQRFEIKLLVNYSIPFYSLIFFAFFGFGDESVKEYLRLWRIVKKFFTSEGRVNGREELHAFGLKASTLGSKVATSNNREWDSRSHTEGFVSIAMENATEFHDVQGKNFNRIPVKIETSVV